MTYAIICTGGKQYKVSPGQYLKVEKIEISDDKDIEFDKVLLRSTSEKDKTKTEIGKPYIKGAKVIAKLLRHGRHKKINILKFKRRKHHMKRMGHRQWFSEIEIVSVN